MATPVEILKQYFGHTAFRPGQEGLIRTLLSGRDVLGVMPTGAGKSVCYQIPALLSDGITLVISPLISLMRDQVLALIESGVHAAYLNSSMTQAQYLRTLDRAKEGRYKIIYVAPERLLTEGFMAFAKDANISILAIDEAHCVSQWGQDFRPAYLGIAEFCNTLPRRPVVAAFTATATQKVKEDIINLLRLENPFETVTGFDRPNLYFAVEQPGEKFTALMRALKRNEGKSGIVYCSTRKNVEEVCKRLCANGYEATAYHGGMTAADRDHNQEEFLYDRKTIMVATNAFGMGIDKSNVSFVIHYNMPKNIESYYQEAGRAGRDGAPAECILLYGPQDVHTQQFFINKTLEESEQPPEIRQAIFEKDSQLLKQMVFYSTGTTCLRAALLRYFGEKAPDYCGHCSNCQNGFETIEISHEARMVVSCILQLKKQHRQYGRTMIAEILHGSRSERIRQNKLENLPAYGSLSGLSLDRIHAVLRHLIQTEYLCVEDENYGVLSVTKKAQILGQDVDTPIYLQIPKAPVYAYSTIQTANEELLARLKDLRKRVARKAGVPAFVVFTDATLQEMSIRCPETIGEFLELPGVGEVKAQRFGEDFLTEIRGFLANQSSGH